jgi:hypothetical protein
MDKVEFLDKLYFHELDRKQALESMFAFPAGIIAGLFGVVGCFFTHFNFIVTDQQFGFLLRLIFLVASGLAVFALVVSTVRCARAVIGSEY